MVVSSEGSERRIQELGKDVYCHYEPVDIKITYLHILDLAFLNDI